MKSAIIKFLFVFVFVLSLSTHAQAQSDITLTTFYPSPFGVYQQLEIAETIVIQPSSAPACSTDGLMYFDANEGLRICDNGAWSGNAGVWQKTVGSDAIYPVDLNYSVGVGTNNPDQIFHVVGNVKVEGNSLIIMGDDGEAGPYGFDFDTGSAFLLYEPAAAQLIFEDGSNADQFIVDADNNVAFFAGNVAIGVTTGAVANALEVTGNISASGNAGITGNATIGGTASVTGATTFSNTLNVTGIATLTNDLNVAGNTNINADLGVTGATLLTGQVGIGNPPTPDSGRVLDVNGNVQADGYFYTSDESLKKDIQPVSGLESVLKLQGVRYTWKKDGSTDIGITAQNVEKVFPEIVDTNSTTGLKSVKSDRIIAPLIEAVKEQQQMIEAQQEEIQQLRSEINILKESSF